MKIGGITEGYYGPPPTREEFVLLLERVSALEKQLAQPQPDSDGWIPWGGGGCPVSHNDWVDIKVREDEVVSDVHAGSARWEHSPAYFQCHSRDIIAYRPAKQEAEWPQVGDAYWCINELMDVELKSWDGDAVDCAHRDGLGIYRHQSGALNARDRFMRIMDHLRSGKQIQLMARNDVMAEVEEVVSL